MPPTIIYFNVCQRNQLLKYAIKAMRHFILVTQHLVISILIFVTCLCIFGFNKNKKRKKKSSVISIVIEYLNMFVFLACF